MNNCPNHGPQPSECRFCIIQNAARLREIEQKRADMAWRGKHPLVEV